MSVLHLNSDNFKSTIENSKVPVLVDFFADWCGPCKMFAPILDKVASHCGDKAVIAKLNIDENEDLAMAYQVMSIPTVLVFKNGEEVARKVGVLSASDVLALLGVE